MKGPGYLPQNARELALWAALVLVGAVLGRCFAVFAYRACR